VSGDVSPRATSAPISFHVHTKGEPEVEAKYLSCRSAQVRNDNPVVLVRPNAGYLHVFAERAAFFRTRVQTTLVATFVS